MLAKDLKHQRGRVIHSFNKYVLRVCPVPDTFLGKETTLVKRKGTVSIFIVNTV